MTTTTTITTTNKSRPFGAPARLTTGQVNYREIFVGRGGQVTVDLADVLICEGGPQVCLHGRVAQLFLQGLPEGWFQEMQPLIFVTPLETLPQPWPVVVALGDTIIALFIPENLS